MFITHLGQLVETLVDKEMESGYHEVNFSAKGGSASGGDALNLASGIYLYQLQADKISNCEEDVAY